jgi:probable rRNA maturation factor
MSGSPSGPGLPAVHVEIVDRQGRWPVDAEALRAIVRSVLSAEGPPTSDVNVAVVDDRQIHALNREFLAHDEPTDVLTFVIERTADRLEGEIALSAETAARAASEIGWPYEHELLLYALHGALHLVGYDDLDPAAARRMQAAEAEYLRRTSIDPRGSGRGAEWPAPDPGAAP